MTAETRAENPLRNRLYLHTSKKSRRCHTTILEHIDSVHLPDGISFEVCEFVGARACVCCRPEFSVAYGNVLPPTILHLLLWYHSPSSLWSASRWHSCLASFITALWWMRWPHLHNSARAGVAGMKGNPQEIKNSGHPPETCKTCLVSFWREGNIFVKMCLNTLFKEKNNILLKTCIIVKQHKGQ